MEKLAFYDDLALEITACCADNKSNDCGEDQHIIKSPEQFEAQTAQLLKITTPQVVVFNWLNLICRESVSESKSTIRDENPPPEQYVPIHILNNSFLC